MLDISFYSQTKELVEVIEISEKFYEWLIKSGFSRIGKSREMNMIVDGEAVKTFVVLLGIKNRKKFGYFTRDAIVKECDNMLDKLGNSPSKQEYIEASSQLRTLCVFRKLIENKQYQYLSRD